MCTDALALARGMVNADGLVVVAGSLYVGSARSCPVRWDALAAPCAPSLGGSRSLTDGRTRFGAAATVHRSWIAPLSL
jgi:hypothetical protein